MIPGFNQNVTFKGEEFHVQTEDSGLEYRHVTTHLYKKGTIIASRKTSYESLRDDQNVFEIVKMLMEEQHRSMVRNLLEGVCTAEGGEAMRLTVVPLGITELLAEDGFGVTEMDDAIREFFSDVVTTDLPEQGGR